MNARPVLCSYCVKPAALVTGQVVYPHRRELWDRSFYLCRPCEAWVGCHRGSDRPFGRLANAELRQAKMAAHAAFDPLWKARGFTRRKAYRWLAEQLQIDARDCHIGMFDVRLCHRTVEVIRQTTAIGRALGSALEASR